MWPRTHPPHTHTLFFLFLYFSSSWFPRSLCQARGARITLNSFCSLAPSHVFTLTSAAYISQLTPGQSLSSTVNILIPGLAVSASKTPTPSRSSCSSLLPPHNSPDHVTANSECLASAGPCTPAILLSLSAPSSAAYSRAPLYSMPSCNSRGFMPPQIPVSFTPLTPLHTRCLHLDIHSHLKPSMPPLSCIPPSMPCSLLHSSVNGITIHTIAHTSNSDVIYDWSLLQSVI